MQTIISESAHHNAANLAKAQRDSNQCLTFNLGTEIYGVDILRVQEIRGWEKPSSLPNMPGYVKGVINMRGQVIPIVDLRERFHVSKPTYDESTVVIITRVFDIRAEDEYEKEHTMGLVVDGVSDVYDVEMETLQQAPSFNDHAVGDEFIRGLATLGKNMVIILDVDHLIQQGIMHANQESIGEKGITKTA